VSNRFTAVSSRSERILRRTIRAHSILAASSLDHLQPLTRQQIKARLVKGFLQNLSRTCFVTKIRSLLMAASKSEFVTKPPLEERHWLGHVHGDNAKNGALQVVPSLRSFETTCRYSHEGWHDEPFIRRIQICCVC
jgi:hypothetical protein